MSYYCKNKPGQQRSEISISYSVVTIYISTRVSGYMNEEATVIVMGTSGQPMAASYPLDISTKSGLN